MHPKTASLVNPAKLSKRDRDLADQRATRSESARITIPKVVNPERRKICLADPELFLRTYFPDKYRLAFCADHKRMISVMVDKAKHGGRQAVAAPRGRGKTEIAKGMLVYLVLAGLCRFPLVVGATADHARMIYKDFRNKIATNDLLLEDFPEVCWPVRALEGAPQRASKQHVDGKLTHIVWTANDYLSLPYVDGSPYGGIKITYFGLDSAFRGVNIDGDRPDYVLVEDPETEESARQIGQIETRERLIDQDISGLASQEDNLAIVVFSTIQNRFCLSYKLTDRKLRPAYNGLRYGMIVKWPNDMEAWQDYVAQRHADQAAGDEYGRSAVKMYLDNREAMDAGAEMLTSEFVPVTLDDGTELVHSSLQAAWNKIADTSMAAYRTEYQNDPEPEDTIETIGLTAARVQSRLGRTLQRERPKDTLCVSMGLDIGKHNSHWTKIAWTEEAAGTIHDYGVMETHGLLQDSDNKTIERALLSTLEIFAEEVRESDIPLLCLVDSGTYSDAIYEACRRLGPPFFASKGWDNKRFRLPKRSTAKIPFDEAYASIQENGLWLYHVNTEYWKQWLHQRFITNPFDEVGERVPGSMVLYDHGGDKKRHLAFAHHIVAEERRRVPVYGKELREEWFVKSRNNHWLDATALACAAAGCVGVHLVQTIVMQHPPEANTATRPRLTTSDGRAYLASER